MDKADLVGKYYKVDMHPGVSLTKDVIMVLILGLRVTTLSISFLTG